MSHASVFLSMRLRHLCSGRQKLQLQDTTEFWGTQIEYLILSLHALRVTHLSSFRSKKAQQWRRKLGRAVEGEWDSRSGGLRNSRQVKCDFVTYIIIKC